MNKSLYVTLALLCTVLITGCGRKIPQAPAESYHNEASTSSAETALPAAGTINSSDTGSDDTEPADTAPPEEEQTVPATVAAYMSMAETLWRSDQEHIDYRTAYNNEALDQCRAVNLEKDYGCEIILPEDFAETGNFTLSLSVNGTDDGLFVLEGDQTQVSIVFGEAYRLGNILYMGTNISDVPPFALNLETKTLTDCKKEYETLQSLYADYLRGQPENTNLKIQRLHPMAQVDGCLIYLAAISEAMDTDTRAIIYAAFDEFHSLRAYLLLTEADYLSPSDLSITLQTEVTLEISELSSFGRSCSLTIHNAGTETVCCSNQYSLEKSIGGIWYPVTMLISEDEAKHLWTDELYTLKAGEELTLQLPLDSFYGSFPAGSYRLIKSLSYPENTDSSEKFNIAAYFEIE